MDTAGDQARAVRRALGGPDERIPEDKVSRLKEIERANEARAKIIAEGGGPAAKIKLELWEEHLFRLGDAEAMKRTLETLKTEPEHSIAFERATRRVREGAPVSLVPKLMEIVNSGELKSSVSLSDTPLPLPRALNVTYTLFHVLIRSNDAPTSVKEWALAQKAAGKEPIEMREVLQLWWKENEATIARGAFNEMKPGIAAASSLIMQSASGRESIVPEAISHYAADGQRSSETLIFTGVILVLVFACLMLWRRQCK